MPVEITRRSFIGASALALASITPLAGCSSGGSSSSSASSGADDQTDATASESVQEEITVSNAKWEHAAENDHWLRCTGTLTNNTDEDIGRFDIVIDCKKRYTDKYGDAVESNYGFKAQTTICDIIPISGVATARIGEYSNYGLNEYSFVDLRARETVDFEYIIVPDEEYAYDGGDDVDFYEPEFTAEAISYEPAVELENNKEKTTYVYDRLHDFDVEMTGGNSWDGAAFRITNNSSDYADKGSVRFLCREDYYDEDGEHIVSCYVEGTYFEILKPGASIEVSPKDKSLSEYIEVIHPICVRYHVDEDK